MQKNCYKVKRRNRAIGRYGILVFHSITCFSSTRDGLVSIIRIHICVAVNAVIQLVLKCSKWNLSSITPIDLHTQIICNIYVYVSIQLQCILSNDRKDVCFVRFSFQLTSKRHTHTHIYFIHPTFL